MNNAAGVQELNARKQGREPRFGMVLSHFDRHEARMESPGRASVGACGGRRSATHIVIKA